MFNSDKAGPRNALIDEMTLTMDHRPTYVNMYPFLFNFIFRINQITSNINEVGYLRFVEEFEIICDKIPEVKSPQKNKWPESTNYCHWGFESPVKKSLYW